MEGNVDLRGTLSGLLPCGTEEALTECRGISVEYWLTMSRSSPCYYETKGSKVGPILTQTNQHSANWNPPGICLFQVATLLSGPLLY